MQKVDGLICQQFLSLRNYPFAVNHPACSVKDAFIFIIPSDNISGTVKNRGQSAGI
jgi:hypothetical protein